MERARARCRRGCVLSPPHSAVATRSDEDRRRAIRRPPSRHARKDGRVRPTADRVREAWMSILGQRAAGRPRARSLRRKRGARSGGALPRRRLGHFVELNPPSLARSEQHRRPWASSRDVTVHRGDAMRFAERLPPGAFDIVLADPPYTCRLRRAAGRRSSAATRSRAFFPSSIGPTSSSTATTPAATATPPSPSATRHDPHRGVSRLVRSTDAGP